MNGNAPSGLVNRAAQPIALGISGNIGAGKTRLTRLLSEILGWRAYYEPVVANPYLEDFYADMQRYSFHLQIFFLSERFRVMHACAEAGEPLIQDRTLYEDGEVFAPTLRDLGMLTERDYQNYRALYETLLATVQPPRRILLLSAPSDVLLARIRKRNRPYEHHVDAAYLAMLERRYQDWASRMEGLTPVRRIDTSLLDLDGPGDVWGPFMDDLVGWIRGGDGG